MMRHIDDAYVALGTGGSRLPWQKMSGGSALLQLGNGRARKSKLRGTSKCDVSLSSKERNRC